MPVRIAQGVLEQGAAGIAPGRSSVLHEFLTVHRDEIIARTRLKVASRPAPQVTQAEL